MHLFSEKIFYHVRVREWLFTLLCEFVDFKSFSVMFHYNTQYYALNPWSVMLSTQLFVRQNIVVVCVKKQKKIHLSHRRVLKSTRRIFDSLFRRYPLTADQYLEVPHSEDSLESWCPLFRNPNHNIAFSQHYIYSYVIVYTYPSSLLRD